MDKNRGDLPIGVYHQLGRFYAILGDDRLGEYSKPEEAFRAYKVAKEEQIKEVAEEWKSTISPELYDAMHKWVVEIND